MRRALVFVIVLLAAAAAVAFARWPKAERAKAVGRPLNTAEVKPARFEVTLRVGGVLEAEKTQPITNQSRRAQIVSVLLDGTWVKPGDVVMKLDDTEMKREVSNQETQDADASAQEVSSIAEAQKRVQNARAGLEKAKDDLRLTQVQSKAAIEKATAELEYMQKELEVSQGQLDKRKRLAAERLMPLTQVEQVEDEVRAKQFGLERAQRGLEAAKQDAETSDRIRELDIRKAELELTLAESALAQTEAEAKRSRALREQNLRDARKQLADTEVKAPLAGMLLLEKIRDESGMRPLRVGDQIGEGQRVANVIDPSQMRVRCDIGEADIERVKPGQRALVRVPAIGNSLLEGTVKSIDNLATERSWFEGGTPGQKVFGAIIVVAGRERRLRPGMGATVEIVVDSVAAGLAVPAEALFPKDGKVVVYIAEGKRYREAVVKVGKRNEMMVAVSGPLKVGDRVARERPLASMLVGAEENRR
jgi:HlyD family secretion protein